MKKLNQLVVFTVLTLNAFLLINCNNAEQDALVPAKSLEAILFEIAELGRAEKKIISFEIIFDKQSNSYAYDDVEIVEHSKKVIDFVKGADPGYKYMGDSIEVTCTDAEGNETVTNCSDYACVGYHVALCVETGGCAKVCKVDATYYPPEL